MTGHGIFAEYYTLEEALFVTNLYRLFGHDMELYDVVTRNNIRPWASARECIIEPASIDFSPAREKQIAFYTNVPREGRTHVLPNVGALLTAGAFSVAYQRPLLSVNSWRSRMVPLRPHVVTRRVKTATKFFVQAPMTYRPVQFTAMPAPKRKESGFREPPSGDTPSKPEMLRVRHLADANAFTEPSAMDVLYAGASVVESHGSEAAAMQ
jgi:hypothetical protein